MRFDGEVDYECFRGFKYRCEVCLYLCVFFREGDCYWDGVELIVL